MAWTVEFNGYALKKLRRLEPQAHQRILKYLKNHIEGFSDPSVYGKPLRGHPAGRWRYRAGDYRIICRHDHDSKAVVVLDVGHRRDIYERKT